MTNYNLYRRMHAFTWALMTVKLKLATGHLSRACEVTASKILMQCDSSKHHDLEV